MHTFFINTSSSTFSNIEDILDMQIKSKRFIQYNLPFESYMDESNGYVSCVKKIGKDIDDYKEINHKFNLVVYFDLHEDDKMYAELRQNDFRPAYYRSVARKTLLKKLVYDTLYTKLCSLGRVPHSVLIIFGAEPFAEEVSSRPEMTAEGFVRELGYPSFKEIKQILTEIAELDEEARKKRMSDLMASRGETVIDAVKDYYADHIDYFLKELFWYSKDTEEKIITSIKETSEELTGRIQKEDGAVSFTVKTADFEFAQEPVNENRQARARRDMLMYMYLWDITQSGDITADAGVPYSEAVGKPFYKMDEKAWDTVEDWLYSKYRAYGDKIAEIESYGQFGTDNGCVLVPKLFVFDHEKFDLRESGDPALLVTSKEVDADKSKDKNKDKNDNEYIVKGTKKYDISVQRVSNGPLLDLADYIPFSESADVVDDENEPKSKEECTAKANSIYANLLGYFSNLRMQMSNVLPRYAGKGINNAPAILSKRKVTVTKSHNTSNTSKCNWSKDNLEDTDTTNVSAVSQRAYQTVEKDYLTFCTERSLKAVEIKSQAEWVQARISEADNVAKSIRKSVFAAWGCTLLSFVPFIAIQWDYIFANWYTVAAMGATIAGALLLMGALTPMAYIMHKKAYAKPWKEYLKAVSGASARSTGVLMAYDRFLGRVIPSLRWVYEYKLDVEFYVDCCAVAGKKLSHHKERANSRADIVHNILTDLGVNVTHDREAGDFNVARNVNYSASYCANSENCEFYSIINSELIDKLK